MPAAEPGFPSDADDWFSAFPDATSLAGRVVRADVLDQATADAPANAVAAFSEGRRRAAREAPTPARRPTLPDLRGHLASQPSVSGSRTPRPRRSGPPADGATVDPELAFRMTGRAVLPSDATARPRHATARPRCTKGRPAACGGASASRRQTTARRARGTRWKLHAIVSAPHTIDATRRASAWRPELTC
jgi:hypothetical protein